MFDCLSTGCDLEWVTGSSQCPALNPQILGSPPGRGVRPEDLPSAGDRLALFSSVPVLVFVLFVCGSRQVFCY